MDCIVHGVAKSWTQLSDFHKYSQICTDEFFVKNRTFHKKERLDSKEVLLSICIEAKFYSVNAVENIPPFHTLKNIQITTEYILSTPFW